VDLPTPVSSEGIGEQWVLELPFTKALSLNDRMAHIVKWLKTKEWRDAAHVLAKAQKIPRCRRVRIELHYRPVDNRRRDVINLAAALKPLEDGIVDAGVVPDDTPEFIEPTLPIIHEKGQPLKNGGRFWLVITRLA
jgi:crossover junction endodeoxyribonuclease RusA